MAEVEPNDDDVFEIDDFTVVSPLETLVSALEVAIHESALEGARPVYDLQRLISNFHLEVTEHIVPYESNSFVLRWFRPSPECEKKKNDENVEEDDDDEEHIEGRRIPQNDKLTSHYTSAAREITSASLDFCTNNNICAMYGVSEFLVLSGVHSTNDRIATHEQKDFVMSAVRVSLNNTQCEIPFFVLCGNPERELYFGASETRQQSMTFLSAHLHNILPRHTNITGLIGLMKEKVRTKASVVDIEEIRASVRFEYEFKEPEKSRHLHRGDEKKFVKDCRDCRAALKLFLICRWPNVPETRVHENEAFTNLEPHDAPFWEIFADFSPTFQPFAHRLKCALNASQNESSPHAKELFTLPHTSDDERTPLVKEGKEELRVQNMGESDWRNLLGGDVLSEVDEGDRRYPSWSKESALKSSSDPYLAACLKELRHVKSASPRSIAARLAIQLSHVVDDESDMAVKWIAFVRLLRWHWENNIPLPGMLKIETPNLGSCLLNQKLEMLECCIKSRQKRHAEFENLKDFGHDEFFDAEEELEETKTSDVTDKTPLGRMEQLGDLTLYNHPEIPLFVPSTQMACPMTEDMVTAHAEHISSLPEGDERTEAQLGLLRSDMQAFKAANPQCQLVDFIRWHSPKDWDAENGSLSDRMLIPGNAWDRCWRTCSPIAAIHQQPHFNEATVAEGILSHFEHATVAQVCEWILPLLFHLATLQLIMEDEYVREMGEGTRLCSLVSRATRDFAHPARASFYQALHQLRKYERLAHMHSHLWRTFWRQQFLQRETEEKVIRDLVKRIILESGEERNEGAMFRRGVPLSGAGTHILGEIIAGDFQGQNGLLRKNQLPCRKSYVLYWRVPVPGVNSRLQPQRIFANIEYDNNRLCSATTLDTVFI